MPPCQISPQQCIVLPLQGEKQKFQPASKNNMGVYRKMTAWKPRTVQPFLVAVLDFAVSICRPYGFCRRLGMSPFWLSPIWFVADYTILRAANEVELTQCWASSRLSASRCEEVDVHWRHTAARHDCLPSSSHHQVSWWTAVLIHRRLHTSHTSANFCRSIHAIFSLFSILLPTPTVVVRVEFSVAF